jgi:hypothetical protein
MAAPGALSSPSPSPSGPIGGDLSTRNNAPATGAPPAAVTKKETASSLGIGGPETASSLGISEGKPF